MRKWKRIFSILILVPFLVFMMGTGFYVRAMDSDKNVGIVTLGESKPPEGGTVIPGESKPPEGGIVTPGETKPPEGGIVIPGETKPPEGEIVTPGENKPPEGGIVTPEETKPPEGGTVTPGETKPPEGGTVTPGETKPPEAGTVTPGEIKPSEAEIVPQAEQIGSEVVPQRKDYVDKFVDDVPEVIDSNNAKYAMLKTTSPGTVEVYKTANPVEGCRTYEIELKILGTPPPAKPVDVVLVIDRSGSMAHGDALEDAKTAAINFAKTVLSNPNNRVAVVSYAGAYLGLYDDATLNKSLTSDFDKVKKAIQSITAYGGTNIQAGFNKAKNELEDYGRSTANKAIVLLSDGVANLSTSIQLPYNWPTDHNDHTINAYKAGQLAQSIAQVFTIGLFNGIVENQPSNQKPHTTLWVAQDTLKRAAQKGNYFDSPDSSSLKDIYEKIANVINYSATSATVTDIISPEVMKNFDIIPGSMISSQGSFSISEDTIEWVLGTIGTEATLKYKIKAKENYEGSKGVEIATNTWAILTYTDINGVENNKKTFPVPSIIVPPPLRVNAGEDIVIGLGEYAVLGGNPVASGGFTPYREVKWTLEDKVISNELNLKLNVDTNATYTLTVKDKYGCTRCDSVNVTVIRGEITIIKRVLDQNGKIISDSNEFAINIFGPLTGSLPENRIKSIGWNLFLKGNGEGTTFKELPLRRYNISEIYKPVGYKVVNITPSIVNLTKSSNSITVIITNQIEKKGWFTDNCEKDNYFRTSSKASKSGEEENNTAKLKDVALDRPKEKYF